MKRLMKIANQMNNPRNRDRFLLVPVIRANYRQIVGQRFEEAVTAHKCAIVFRQIGKMPWIVRVIWIVISDVFIRIARCVNKVAICF